MKKLILIFHAVLFIACTSLLLGCAPENTNITPVLYWNADRGVERIPEADGSYQVLFLLDGEQVTLRVPSEEMMKKIDKQDALGLTVDSRNTITSVTHIMDMPQYYLTLDYLIKSFGGKTVKLNSTTSFTGQSVVVNFDENTKILDVSNFAATKGEVTVLQKGDSATIIANPDGTIPYIFITQRQGIYTTVQRYCPICEKDVEFTNWFSGASLPFISGHYFLEKDIELGVTTSVASVEITLDLNGKTATMVKEGQRFYSLGDNATLNLIDTVGNGKAVVASSGKGVFNTGMFVYMSGDSIFNMYSGTIDATDCVCSCGCIVDNLNGIFNMYGGTLLGGTTTGVGGGAIIVQNEVNIYGGEIVGGYCATRIGAASNPPGGGCIRHNGADKVLNIYGGIIRGGTTDYNGGCIFINGPLNIYGGTITGGSAEMAGGGIYVGASGAINISGDVDITGNENGNIYLLDGKTLTVGEAGLGDCRIDVTMAKNGTFTSNAVPKDKVSCFTSANGEIIRNADGTLALK